MSKITNDSLTRSDTDRMLYSCTHMATSGRQRVKRLLLSVDVMVGMHSMIALKTVV